MPCYLHQGSQFRVGVLDTEGHLARLEPCDDADEYTEARSRTEITVVEEQAAAPLGRATVHLGVVEVTAQVLAFQRRRASTNRLIETCDLDLPPQRLVTRACWYRIAEPLLAPIGVDRDRLLGVVHAAEHAVIGMLPLFTICDRWDVGGVSMANHPQTGEPTIFVYDGYPGGVGIADLAFDAAARHVRATRDLVGRVSLRRWLPVVRAVAQVRQLERVPRQGGCHRPADDHGPGRGQPMRSASARARPPTRDGRPGGPVPDTLTNTSALSPAQ